MKQISAAILALLRDVAEGRIPGGLKSLRILDNRPLRAAVNRGWLVITSRRIALTTAGLDAYERFTRGETPLRKRETEVSRTIAEILNHRKGRRT